MPVDTRSLQNFSKSSTKGHGHACTLPELPRTLDKPEKEVPLEPDDEPENLEENEGPADKVADYVQDFKVFMAKVKAGSFSALNVSFENLRQILELSTPSCSVTPLLIDYGLDVSNPYDINAVRRGRASTRSRSSRMSRNTSSIPVGTRIIL